ncbi:MAG: hypothetical protein WD071_07365 [Pseudohongiella sp.]|uniref:hypothetical protein n=1 Tax=Pseudohongiella sp. TaxID=1979412 RepID=UPI0034A05070
MKKSIKFRFSFFLMLLLSQAALFAPSKAMALYSVCSWYESGGTPFLYADAHYSSADTFSHNAIEISTSLTPAIYPPALTHWLVSPSGGYFGHAAPVTTGTTYTVSSQGLMGNKVGEYFNPGSLPASSCSGSFLFEPPTNVFVDINPATVTVGDSVTITWGSQNATACLFDGAPIATSGVHNFTAALSDSRTYTLECENLWGESITGSLLTVNECGPDDPAFVSPGPASIPGISQVPYVNSGASWGSTRIDADYSALACNQICVNGSYKYRMEGDISVDSFESYVRVATMLPDIANSGDSCSANPRSAPNISRTQTHEIVHADALVNVINAAKSNGELGSLHDDLQSCNLVKDQYVAETNSELQSEISRQQDHLDHAGQSRWIPFCENDGDPTVELECGVDGLQCSPSNTYPSP